MLPLLFGHKQARSIVVRKFKMLRVSRLYFTLIPEPLQKLRGFLKNLFFSKRLLSFCFRWFVSYSPFNAYWEFLIPLPGLNRARIANW